MLTDRMLKQNSHRRFVHRQVLAATGGGRATGNHVIDYWNYPRYTPEIGCFPSTAPPAAAINFRSGKSAAQQTIVTSSPLSYRDCVTGSGDRKQQLPVPTSSTSLKRNEPSKSIRVPQQPQQQQQQQRQQDAHHNNNRNRRAHPTVTSHNFSPADSDSTPPTHHLYQQGESPSSGDDCYFGDDVFPMATAKTMATDDKCWTVEDDDAYWSQTAPPSDTSLAAIARHISYYLSDEYLQRDKYLLRQVRCKKDGYISLKLITSFKNIKKLTTDCCVVRSAIVRKSDSIVVSSDGLRVRRRTSLPENLKKPRLLKTVLAIRLPDSYRSEADVTSLFRMFGEINYIRLLEAGREVPSDLRNYATQVKDIGHSLCAVVNFRTTDAALDAVRNIKQHLRHADDVINGTPPPPQAPISDVEEGGGGKQLLPVPNNNGNGYESYRKRLSELPDLGDCRLALLGPRVRRTLYRQDKTTSSAANATPPPPSIMTSSNSSSSSSYEPEAIAATGSATRHHHHHHTALRHPRGPDGSGGFRLVRSV